MHWTVTSILNKYGYHVAAFDLHGHGSAAKTSSFAFEIARSSVTEKIPYLQKDL
jgi:alpha-beta hydrolase superfamily lysophospholipase